jgi:thiol-disulfide isomerase/thioredoxin
VRASLSFALVAVASLAAGAGLYLAARPPVQLTEPQIGPGALYAATFRDAQGHDATLGQFSGRPMVLNFWATWCAPCREEMPMFARVAARDEGRVTFVGLAQDDPDKVRRFGAQMGVGYPLWTGGDDVMELSERLGNHMRVLPFTVILDPDGRVVAQKVGAYSEEELTARLAEVASKIAQPR